MEELIPILEQLAKELNTTVEFLWQVLIKQANVFVVIYICQFILLMVLGYVSYRSILVFIYWEEADDNSWQCVASCIVSLISILVVAVLTIIVTFTFAEFLTALLNPEYWALQQILEQIK